SSSTVALEATLRPVKKPEALPRRILLTEAKIGASEEITVNIIANKIAELIISAIDIWEANHGAEEVHGMDLLSLGPKGEI
ncbi:hypothetical protein, partial [Lactiplantibacillus plantarum]